MVYYLLFYSHDDTMVIFWPFASHDVSDMDMASTKIHSLLVREGASDFNEKIVLEHDLQTDFPTYSV